MKKTRPDDRVDARNDRAAYGLTKREYFAAMAMQGLLSCEAKNTTLFDGSMHLPPEYAAAAVLAADALIVALNKETE